MWLVKGDDGVPSFYLSRGPVANVQYEALVPSFERAASSPGDADPALGIAFDEALAWCAAYASLARKPFRLPTDREWDYAARASVATGAWHAGVSGGRARDPDLAPPDRLGLYDLLGNAWEWTAEGCLRGGSFRTPGRELSPALRLVPGARRDDAGFRVARSL
jgi:formylglycine-generating enzyme required for sulfatase activity